MTFLSPRDAARRLGITVQRVIQLDNDGALSALKDSAGRRFFLDGDVERLARERAARGGKCARKTSPTAA